MRTRITIQTTEELDRALEQARGVTGRREKSDVVRDALELYDLVVQHIRMGKHLYLGASRESAGEVVLPHLEQAAGRNGSALPSPRRIPAATPYSATPIHSTEVTTDAESVAEDEPDSP
jgi:hypothetical protein